MKKIFFLLTIIIASVSCSNYPSVDNFSERECYSLPSGGKITYVEFKNHRYILFENGYHGSLTHDPDCPYCKNIENNQNYE